jgi:hypothetical protein
VIGVLLPDVVIQDVHTLGEEMGFRRLRVDRSGFGGTDQAPDLWFEVGYATQEIHIRTSVERLKMRRRYDLIDMEEVMQLFSELLNWSPEEGPQ